MHKASRQVEKRNKSTLDNFRARPTREPNIAAITSDGACSSHPYKWLPDYLFLSCPLPGLPSSLLLFPLAFPLPLSDLSLSLP